MTVVGCSNAWAPTGGATSGYLIESQQTTVLLDCGHGVAAAVRRYIDPHQLDAVIISHLHADHCADLISLGYMLRFHPHDRMGHRPTLIVPAGEHDRLRLLGSAYGDADVFDTAFDVRELAAGTERKVGDVIVTGVRVPHPLPTLALDLRVDDRARLTYGADCGPNDALSALAERTPLLMIEATLPHASEDHLSARSAGELARRANADQCLLVHVCDAYDPEEVRREGQAGFGLPVQIAVPGQQIIVPGPSSGGIRLIASA